MFKWIVMIVLTFSLAPLARLDATTLVSPETVQTQKKQTQIFALKNGMKVIYRHIENTEIGTLTLTYPFGLINLNPENKSHVNALFSMMPVAAKGFSKQEVFALEERYSGGVGCSSGIEISTCSLATVNDYWDQLLPLMVAVTQSPTFPDEDLTLLKKSRKAELEARTQEPGSYVNEVVNRSFYPPGHPYRLSIEDELKQLGALKRADLVALHAQVAPRAGQFLTYVGSMPLAKVKKDLAAAFGKLKLKPHKKPEIPQPGFDAKDILSVENKPIPTAYINIKFNGPGQDHPDYLATNLMMRILSEELGLEIRTKRSLSYAVYSYMISHSIGIGVISATTSKPKETLAAIDEILTRFKKKVYSEKELDRYKNVYTTNYFLTLEESAALSSALSSSYYHKGSLDPFYEQPLQLGALKPKEIHRVAQKYLKNLRVGVIFEQKQFEKKWVAELVSRHKA